MSNLFNENDASSQWGMLLQWLSTKFMVRHKKVGIRLEEPTFTHGQLHVAATSVAETQHHHFAVSNSFSRKTWNVVYKWNHINRWGSVHSNRGAINMFIAEFRPTLLCNWYVTLCDCTTLPGFLRDQSDDQEYAIVRQEEVITRKSKLRLPSSN